MPAPRIYDSTNRSAKRGKKRVADRTPEEIAAYKENMEEVRDEVELIRTLVHQGGTKIEPNDLQSALEILGDELVEEIIHDPQERPHRRICQGRAASCHPQSDRRYAYVIIAGAQRSVIERAISIHRGEPDPGEPPKRERRRREDPELAQYKSGEGVYSFEGETEVPAETEWQRKLREMSESLQQGE